MFPDDSGLNIPDPECKGLNEGDSVESLVAMSTLVWSDDWRSTTVPYLSIYYSLFVIELLLN